MILQRERRYEVGEEWEVSESGLYLPPSEEAEEPPLGVDLFAGAGGFSLGFHMAGFHVVAALEHDFWATCTYLSNLGAPDTELVFPTDEDAERWERSIKKARKQKGVPAHSQGAWEPEQWGTGWLASARADRFAEGVSSTPWDRSGDDPGAWCLEPCELFVFGDARAVEGEDLLEWLGLERDEVTAVFGGPPCQGFSLGGKRQVMDPRNSLVFDFMRIVVGVHPLTFLMENVMGMASMVTEDGVPVVDALARIAADGGFGRYEAIRRALQNTGGVAALAGTTQTDKRSNSPKAKPKKKPKDPDGQEALPL